MFGRLTGEIGYENVMRLSPAKQVWGSSDQDRKFKCGPRAALPVKPFNLLPRQIENFGLTGQYGKVLLRGQADEWST